MTTSTRPDSPNSIPAGGTDWLISVDDHVVEPPGVWVDRLPSTYQDAAPRYIQDDATWVFGDQRVPTSFGVSAGPVPVAERPGHPSIVAINDMDPSCYDADARLEAMNIDHNLAALLFPTFSQVCGQTFHFHAPHDPQLALLCVQAYNDWMLDEWCDAHPGRFIGNMLIPLWDPPSAAKEVERTAGRGARAVSFPGSPGDVGLPPVNDDHGYWDPVLAAAAEAGMVVCTHLSMMPGLIGIRVLQSWLASTKFQQFPNLKLALSEGGIGWIPATLGAFEWSAYTAKRTQAPVRDVPRVQPEPNRHNWSTPGFISAQPLTEVIRVPPDIPFAEVFRDHVYGCFIYDPLGIRTIDEIGRDNVMIETDFPHASGLWPDSFQVANEQLASLSEVDRYKILQGNARRVYNFEPASPPQEPLARGRA